MDIHGLNILIDEIIHQANDDKNDKEFMTYSKFIEMSAYENDLYDRKIKIIAGIDEVGRGPLAGPVMACAVILPSDFYLPGVNDSKQLSAKKREEYYDYIIKHAVSVGIGTVYQDDIDKYNIYNSTKMAMLQAISSLTLKPEHLLIDAMKLDTDIPQTGIIKGDAKSISIASASIVAKVTRDRYMQQLDKEYPEYNFKNNAGYGTKEHLEALRKYGVTPHHRKTFEPVKSMLFEANTLFNL